MQSAFDFRHERLRRRYSLLPKTLRLTPPIPPDAPVTIAVSLPDIHNLSFELRRPPVPRIESCAVRPRKGNRRAGQRCLSSPFAKGVSAGWRIAPTHCCPAAQTG